MSNTADCPQRKPVIRILHLAAFAFVLAIQCLVAAHAQDSDAPKPAKLFDVEDTLAVTIKAPWRDIERKKKIQDPYPATIEYVDELGNSMSLP